MIADVLRTAVGVSNPDCKRSCVSPINFIEISESVSGLKKTV